jgi:hypothetical protein
MITLIEVGEGKHRVWLREETLGEDMLLVLGGGEKPHIGTVILCEPKEGKRGCTASVLNVTGHRDVEVARKLAERVCTRTGRRVVCVAGIHVENATEKDIEKIIKNCEMLGGKL